MKTVVRILAVILSLSLVFACKKNSNDTGTAYNGPRLSKVIVWTSLSPTPSIEIYEYHFDALKRVTEMTYARGDSASGESQATYMSSNAKKWFYNGDEQQPYKCTGSGASNYEKYFFYDNQGKLATDSMVSDNCNCYYLEKYSWFNDKIILNSTSATYSVGVTANFRDSSLISNTNYLANYNFNNSPAELRGRLYTYDNKISAFHTLNIHVASPITTAEWGFAPGYSNNNATEVTSGSIPITSLGYGSFIKDKTYTYKYTYNPNNLPDACEANIGSANPLPAHIKFYYTN